MSEEARIGPAPGDQHPDWEQQVNALIDGEMEDQQVAALLALAANEPVLENKLRQARLLQEVLHGLPTPQAPRSLRNKLAQIGREETGIQSLVFSWWRWGAAAAAVSLLLFFNIDAHRQGPSAAEIEQGRRDLVVALGYLQGAGHKAVVKIDGSLIGGVVEPIVEPIKENTVRALRSHIGTKEEFSL
jgi:hypothetical protein